MQYGMSGIFKDNEKINRETDTEGVNVQMQCIWNYKFIKEANRAAMV